MTPFSLFFFFIIRNFLNFEIKNRNFYLSILFFSFEYSSSSSITILELYNRRKKFSSKGENSLWNSFHENFYLCLPSFIMRNAVSSYFSSARNELHPSFTGLRSDFFFFFHSGRVRVAKTRNFVKYHYFEAVHPLKTSCTMDQNR